MFHYISLFTEGRDSSGYSKNKRKREMCAITKRGYGVYNYVIFITSHYMTIMYNVYLHHYTIRVRFRGEWEGSFAPLARVLHLFEVFCQYAHYYRPVCCPSEIFQIHASSPSTNFLNESLSILNMSTIFIHS